MRHGARRRQAHAIHGRAGGACRQRQAVVARGTADADRLQVRGRARGAGGGLSEPAAAGRSGTVVASRQLCAPAHALPRRRCTSSRCLSRHELAVGGQRAASEGRMAADGDGRVAGPRLSQHRAADPAEGGRRSAHRLGHGAAGRPARCRGARRRHRLLPRGIRGTRRSQRRASAADAEKVDLLGRIGAGGEAGSVVQRTARGPGCRADRL